MDVDQDEDPFAAGPERLALVFRAHSRRPCDERAFVLRARGIDSLVRLGEGGWGLLVHATRAAEAERELLLWEEENRDWPPRETLPPKGIGVLEGAALYAAVLVLAYVCSVGAAFGRDWSARGASDGAAIRAGELWRTVTALTLHTGPPHLISNLAFGMFFGSLLAFSYGGGTAWLATLAAAVLGTLTNALLLSPEHVSVGASTGVFGSIGLLVGSEWRRRWLVRTTLLRRLAPFLIGLVLFSEFGVGGERTDLTAHLTGLLWGVPLGALLAHLPARWCRDRTVQIAAGALTLTAVVLAWSLAMLIGT